MLAIVLAKSKQTLTLRRFNNVLTAVIVLFALYIGLLPYLPNLGWWVQHEAPVISRPASIDLPKSVADIPAESTLVIPSIGLRETIHEGPGEATLNLGIWHIPNTSQPENGSNTVMAAHRHTRSGIGVFYHLDKVHVNDTIYMYRNKHRYTYTVQKSEVVPPTQLSIESPTIEPTLTPYTCTPLWTFTDRLVVQAKLQEKS